MRSAINGIQYLTATKSSNSTYKDGTTAFLKDCKHYNCMDEPCHCTHTLHVKTGITVQMVLFSQILMTGDCNTKGNH